MQNIKRILITYFITTLSIFYSCFLYAVTTMYEEENKIVDQIGYLVKTIDSQTFPNTNGGVAFLMLQNPDPGKAQLCYYNSGIIMFDATTAAGKIMYSTLLGAKLSEQAVWATFEQDTTTSAGVCTLTGVRAAG